MERLTAPNDAGEVQRDPLLPSETVSISGQEIPVLKLIVRLCSALAEERIHYCHWKSNEGLVHSASGSNDLDLLVSRRDSQHFTEILHNLGFKEARLIRRRDHPGVLHYYGLDEESGRLVHVHAHYQLVLGDDATKNYRLPLEEPYIATAVRGYLFMVPAPEFEFTIFIIRMVLKHATWDAILRLRSSLSETEQRELVYLRSHVDLKQVRTIMNQHLPFIDDALFDDCVQTLEANHSILFRMQTGHRLHRSLSAHARRHRGVDTFLRLWLRGYGKVLRYLLRRPREKRMANGGALIAVVGGDGAGKSHVVEEIRTWLRGDFLTVRVHLGKPRQSLSSIVIKGVILVGRRLGMFSSTKVRPYTILSQESAVVPGYPWLIWHLLTARDRYRAYVRARRAAAKGALVICDRYPLREIKLMDGPAMASIARSPARNSLVRRIIDLERTYYERIRDPDVLFVLRIDPNLAVQRKPEEDEAFVTARCNEVWKADWEGTSASVIDAHLSKAKVLSEIKSVVWSRL
jgi:thymidylate kinase